MQLNQTATQRLGYLVAMGLVLFVTYKFARLGVDAYVGRSLR